MGSPATLPALARSASKRAEISTAVPPTREQWDRTYGAAPAPPAPSTPSSEPAPSPPSSKPVTVDEMLDLVTNTTERSQVRAAVAQLRGVGFDDIGVLRILMADVRGERALRGSADDKVIALLAAQGPIESATGDVIDLIANALDLSASSITQSLVRLDRAKTIVRDARHGRGTFRVALAEDVS